MTNGSQTGITRAAGDSLDVRDPWTGAPDDLTPSNLDRWYSGPSYRGPWQYRPGPPQSLHGFQPNAWGGYQDRARGYYQSNPNWKHFKPPR